MAKIKCVFVVNSSIRDEIQECVRECSYVYHLLHKLHLMGHTQDSSHLLGLYLALTSINLGECGGVAGKALVLAHLHSGNGIRNVICTDFAIGM